MTPLRRIRTLVVTEGGKGRRFVAGTLGSDPAFEVIGTAATGAIALSKLARSRPDVVVFDPVMSVSDPAETIRAIRQGHPRLPIILFNSFVAPGHGVMQTLLSHGANAAIVTAEEADSVAVSRVIRESLIPKMKELGTLPEETAARVDILAIGISTGGPNALPILLAALPGNLPVPVVIVQHMPTVFTKLLAERLNSKCPLEIAEARHGERLHPGCVWLAPGGHHLVVVPQGAGGRLEINQDPPENSCRPSVDPLFRSVAQVYGASTLAVIMTGMGRDGLAGCKAIRAQGGQILAQDEASSVVWGMPGSVVRAGLADGVLPLEALGSEIVRRVQKGRLKPCL